MVNEISDSDYNERARLIPRLDDYLRQGRSINDYVELCLDRMRKISGTERQEALIRFSHETSTVDYNEIMYSLLSALNEKLEIALHPWELDTMHRAQKVMLFNLQERVIDALKYRFSHNEMERILSIAPNESKEDLKGQIEQLIATNAKWQSISQGIEQERRQLQEQIEKKVAEREAFKERWAIWRSFLERESVSTIVGALLIIIIVIILSIATFTHTVTPQILDNGFLVLLGYFFGHTSAKAIDGKKSEGNKED